jgi:hypothetical protein
MYISKDNFKNGADKTINNLYSLFKNMENYCYLIDKTQNFIGQQ